MRGKKKCKCLTESVAELRRATLCLLANAIVAGALRQTKRAPQLLGSKFIKQASNDMVDLSPKAEP
jgi:hypothetical protein